MGRVRTNNEDSLLVLDRLFVVADGMGGHRAGEVASQLAVHALEQTFGAAERIATVDDLIDAVRRANLAIIEESLTNPEHRGMGTTITALAPIEMQGEETLAVINVGDSRTYRLHDGELEQLTEDHSLVQEMVRDGRLSPEEAAIHPQRNIVTRALGVEPDLDVDWLTVTPYAGDRFVLASDGLFDEVGDAKIAAVLRRVPDPYAAAEELVRLANEAGGHDNVTVVVVDVVDDGGRSEAASSALEGEKTQAVPIVGTSFARTGAAPGDDPDARSSADSSQAPEATATEPAKGDGEKGQKRDRRSWLSWRVLAFAAVLVFIAVVALGAVWWQARNTYFVALDDGEVIIFRGQPGGVLWFDPTVEERTGIAEREVPASSRSRLDDGVEYSSLADAERFVTNLQERIDEATTTTAARRRPRPRRPCLRPPCRRRRSAADVRAQRATAGTRRNTELGLIILATIITVAAYTLAGIGRTSNIPANIWPFLGIVLGLLVAAHLFNRRLVPRADGILLPLAALLNGIGYVFIARLNEDLADNQAAWTAIGIGAYVATLLVVRRARDLQRFRYTFMVIGIGLLLLPLVPIVGQEINGARIWVGAGPDQLPTRRVRQDRARHLLRRLPRRQA